MKKTLLSLLGVAVAFSSTAVVPQVMVEGGMTPKFDAVEFPAPLPKTAPEYAAGETTIQFDMADAAKTAVGFNNGGLGKKVAMAFEMTPEITTLYAGKKITQISFYTGRNTGTNTNKVNEIKVFIAEGEALLPVVEKSKVVGSATMTKYTVDLDEPWVIEAGTRLMVGSYGILKTAKDYTIVVDNNTKHSSDIGGWVSLSATKNGNFSWSNLTSEYGYVCMSATIEGESFPENLCYVNEIKLPQNTTINTAFNAEVSLMNMAPNTIESMELICTVGNEAPVTKTVNSIIAGFKSKVVKIEGLSTATASAPVVKVQVSKINGVDVTEKNLFATNTLFVFGPEGGYPRNVVVEEFTGTWCGYCPRGIVTMEYLRENCTDGSIIPIAVHAGDVMEAASFNPVNAMNAEGYPNAMFNRSVQQYPYPPTDIMTLCETLKQDPAAAKITLECNFNEDNMSELVFTGSTEFAFDVQESPYLLSFAITEDGVGPYNQTNNYAGQLQGFPNNPQSVIYNDVARQLDGFSGIEGTVPANNITAHQPNPFTYVMTINNSEINTNKVNGIAYLVNKKTGSLINVAMVKAENIGVTGIEDIAVSEKNDAPVEYFNLQGIRVANPANGIYIRRQGDKVEKVILK